MDMSLALFDFLAVVSESLLYFWERLAFTQLSGNPLELVYSVDRSNWVIVRKKRTV